MVVSAAGDNLITLVDKSLCHDSRIFLYLGLVILERWLKSLTECHSLCRDDMFERTALYTGEHRRVKESRHLAHLTLVIGLAPGIIKVLAEQDKTATRTTEGLMGG